MSATFDPYHKWLGIPPQDQPPNHYRLLGLELFEADLDVISAAADARMGHVKSFHVGPHAELSQQVLNEIAVARLRLLKPERKAAYDAALRQQAVPAVPPAATLIAAHRPTTGPAQAVPT